MKKKLILTIVIILVILGGGYLLRKDMSSKNVPDQSEISAPGTIKIFVISDGTDGEKIGCDDNLIAHEVSTYVPSEPNAQLKVAIQTLLISEPVGQRIMTNVLNQSDLVVEDAVIDSDGKATVNLSGNLSLGGVCDAPRVQNQLEKTALAVPGVSSVEIFINDTPLADMLSQK